MIAKIKEFVKVYHSELTLGIAIISITIISFNLGRMSVGNQVAKLPLTISSPNASGQAVGPLNSESSGPTAKDQTVVASKAASSHLYHFTWCSGAKRIAEKNKITFPNESAAIAAGYSLAGNCQR
ncbi:MAG: hypothetical protein AAB420_02315 [Patescibacteria group bacterium]